MSLTGKIKQKGIDLGFDLVGVTGASPIGGGFAERFGDWLTDGMAGEMGYMHRNIEKRLNPVLLLKNARSVIVVGLNYNRPRQEPSKANSPTGKVAVYAQYEDYHGFIKKRLFELAEFISLQTDKLAGFKVCVDSAPVAERSLAQRAGLGFIGKNHMLINPELGCRILLGEIITDVELECDEPIENNCSDCEKCIAACPAGALAVDGRFDANKCISYLTIEYKGQISEGLGGGIGDNLFGCGLCVEVCPYQRKATACKNSGFKFYGDRAELNLHEVLALTEEQFKERFADSPILRRGLDGLKRNAKTCLENVTKK